MERTIYGPYTRPKKVMEPGGGTTKTEQAYVKPDDQIRRMMEFGERLSTSRKGGFDFQAEEEDDGRIDPTRRPGYDLSDAARDMEAVIERVSASEAAKAAEKAKAAVEAAEARFEAEVAKRLAAAEEALRAGK